MIPSRLKQIFDLCLLIVGLGLLVTVGGKAVLAINDRRYIDGVRQQTAQSQPTLFNDRLMASGEGFQAFLQTTSQEQDTGSPSAKTEASDAKGAANEKSKLESSLDLLNTTEPANFEPPKKGQQGPKGQTRPNNL